MNTETKIETGSRRGRPRKFDLEQALQAATQVFYAQGYEGASLDDLTQAMGINRPSLYACFGNKESLFLKCLAHYTEQNIAKLRAILEQGPARQAIQAALQFIAGNLMTSPGEDPQTLGGCLVANSTILACRESRIGEFLQTLHHQHERLLLDCLQRGVDSGEFPPDTEVLPLAQSLNSIMQGMGILARAQQSPEAVHNVARLALRLLPTEEA